MNGIGQNNNFSFYKVDPKLQPSWDPSPDWNLQKYWEIITLYWSLIKFIEILRAL